MRRFLVSLILFLGISIPAEAMTSDQYERRTTYWINEARERHGIPRVYFDTCLNDRAEYWTRYLAKIGMLKHSSMVTLLEKCDKTWAGEVLAKTGTTPRGTVRMWLNSPTHRSVILSPKARRSGAGAVFRDGRWWVTVDLGSW